MTRLFVANRKRRSQVRWLRTEREISVGLLLWRKLPACDFRHRKLEAYATYFPLGPYCEVTTVSGSKLAHFRSQVEEIHGMAQFQNHSALSLQAAAGHFAPVPHAF